jgi:arsenate reductase (thioredoxin)
MALKEIEMRRTASQMVRAGVCGLVTAAVLSYGAAIDATLAAVERRQHATPTSEKRTTVLFVCPHGAAKSVLASAYFQRLAKERGLNVRVETAGIEPQDAVSPAVANHLRENGYALPIAKPRAATRDDVEAADVVISMGCDLTGLPVAPEKLQKWDDVPAPSENFRAADEAIQRRVIALVEELLNRQRE